MNSTERADPDRHEALGRAARRPRRAGRSARPRPTRSGAARSPRPRRAVRRGARRRRAGATRSRAPARTGRPRATCRRRPRCVSTSRSRFSTNWPISFDDTSSSTPRPNCATLPVIDEVGDDVDLGARAFGRHRHDDRRLRVALPARVAARRVDHDAAVRLVDLGERRRALVLRGDRPDLHLHDAAVLVALDLLQLRAGQARRDALDVEQHLPGVVDRRAHSEAVVRSPS